MNTITLYRLCNRYNWCTNADNEQYEKLFEYNKQIQDDTEYSEKLAVVIYFLSENYTIKEIATKINANL